MTNHYELLYLVPANYTEEELTPIREKVKSLIKKFTGEITYEENFGKKKLAYPIKGNHQGYYLLYEFDLAGENLKELDKILKLTAELLRHIIVKTVKGRVKAPNLMKTTETKVEPTKMVARSKAPEKTPAKEEKEKIKLEDLDKKLDEILEGDIM